jgi:zinc transporter 1/2/3
MIGLGLHAVFEGMALGAENRKSKVLIFALAIFLHKGAAGMSFGISLKQAFPDRMCYATSLMAFFSLFTPIGVILGKVFISHASPIFEIIFSSIAAGSFIYIACSEVIVEEF